MVSLKYSLCRQINTLKKWFHENICFCELSSTNTVKTCLTRLASQELRLVRQDSPVKTINNDKTCTSRLACQDSSVKTRPSRLYKQ